MQSAATTLAATTSTPLTTSTVSSSRATADQQKTQFLQLLVAQLKGQNPLDPKDGTEFVSQLAQFSSLEELINIRTTLEAILTAPAAPATPAPPATNPFEGV